MNRKITKERARRKRKIGRERKKGGGVKRMCGRSRIIRGQCMSLYDEI